MPTEKFVSDLAVLVGTLLKIISLGRLHSSEPKEVVIGLLYDKYPFTRKSHNLMSFYKAGRLCRAQVSKEPI